MVAILSTSNIMDLLLAQTVGVEFICIHYKERWSPANGCNLGTFVQAVCSCCSSDEGVILAHFLITNHLWCSYKTGCLSVPGKHNEKQRNCEETQEKATLSRRIENQSERGHQLAWARVQPWFMQGDTGAGAGHACWDYTQLDRQLDTDHDQHQIRFRTTLMFFLGECGVSFECH